MTRFTDGLRLVEISMYSVDGSDVAPDCEDVILDIYELKYDEVLDAYIVDDVKFLIDEAYDWEHGEGDYEITDEEDNDEFWNDVMDRQVDVEELRLPSDKIMDLVMKLYNEETITLDEARELLVG